jgi:hypothetical protein
MHQIQYVRHTQSEHITGFAKRFWIILSLVMMFVLASCATLTTQPFNPRSINEVKFRDRLQSKYDEDVRVTTAVPSAEEAQAIFGKDLAQKDIQPVWVKVENHSNKTFYLVSITVDPNYFSPLEVSTTVHGGHTEAVQNEIEYYFRSMTFRNPILPNTAVSGFIFTNLDEGEKVVQVDLIGDQEVKFFTFFAQIPGMRVDYRTVNFGDLYQEENIVELRTEGLREALEKLPCCTTDKAGKEFGDPLNLVIVGDFYNVAAAFVRRGWVPAEETYSSAVWKTIKSYFFGSRYRYSPVSPLFFKGRHQDLARQKPRHDIHERNHLRLWLLPMRCEGKPVFIGQVSRDIGVRFTSKTWPPVTHKIDPDIDEARNSVIEDLLFSNTIFKVGFVKGVGRATPSKPRNNLTGDPYFTDGLRAVIFLDPGPTSLEQVRALKWEHPGTFNFGK